MVKSLNDLTRDYIVKDLSNADNSIKLALLTELFSKSTTIDFFKTKTDVDINKVYEYFKKTENLDNFSNLIIINNETISNKIYTKLLNDLSIYYNNKFNNIAITSFNDDITSFITNFGLNRCASINGYLTQDPDCTEFQNLAKYSAPNWQSKDTEGKPIILSKAIDNSQSDLCSNLSNAFTHFNECKDKSWWVVGWILLTLFIVAIIGYIIYRLKFKKKSTDLLNIQPIVTISPELLNIQPIIPPVATIIPPVATGIKESISTGLNNMKDSVVDKYDSFRHKLRRSRRDEDDDRRDRRSRRRYEDDDDY